MSEIPTSLLVDAQGEALVSEQSLPELRVFTVSELTAGLSALLRILVTIHGPEVMQLFAIHAQDIESQLPPLEVGTEQGDYSPPPATDAAFEAATAIDESEVVL